MCFGKSFLLSTGLRAGVSNHVVSNLCCPNIGKGIPIRAVCNGNISVAANRKEMEDWKTGILPAVNGEGIKKAVGDSHCFFILSYAG